MLFRDDLIKLIEINENDLLSENDIKEIFEKYGDDWYIIDGDFQMSTENKERVRLINAIGKSKS